MLHSAARDREGADLPPRYAWEAAIERLPMSSSMLLWCYSFARVCKVKTGHLDLRWSYRDWGNYWGIHRDSARRRIRRMRRYELEGRPIPLIHVEPKFRREARRGMPRIDLRTQRANDYTLEQLEIDGIAPQRRNLTPAAAAPAAVAPAGAGRRSRRRAVPKRKAKTARIKAAAIELSDDGRSLLDLLQSLPRFAEFANAEDAEELARVGRSKSKSRATMRDAITSAAAKARGWTGARKWERLVTFVENHFDVPEPKPAPIARPKVAHASSAAANEPSRAEKLGAAAAKFAGQGHTAGGAVTSLQPMGNRRPKSSSSSSTSSTEDETPTAGDGPSVRGPP